MKQHRSTKTWERTRIQNLLRHKSGRYYARTFTGGKEVWKSLKTRHFEVAQARLAEFLKEHRQRVSNGNSGEASAKMTFGQSAETHLRSLDDDLRIKPGTRDYWRQRLSALIKSRHGLNETEIRKITQAWASAYGKKVSPTNDNNTVALLRHILNVAIAAGVIYGNPAATVKRVPLRRKHVSLPTAAKFNAMITETRAGHGRYSRDCADFAEGLAFTGCRRAKRRRSNGAAWISTPACLLYAAIVKPARRIGKCAVSR